VDRRGASHFLWRCVNLDVGIGIDLVALDDVLVGDLFAGFGIGSGILDPVAGVLVDLVERDFVGLGCGRIERNRTGDERQTQKTLPVGASSHTQNSESTAAQLQGEQGGLVPHAHPLRFILNLAGLRQWDPSFRPGWQLD
jgi:hypothetical protein